MAALVASRQQAVLFEKERQRRYREELIVDIEAEVERRRVSPSYSIDRTPYARTRRLA